MKHLIGYTTVWLIALLALVLWRHALLREGAQQALAHQRADSLRSVIDTQRVRDRQRAHGDSVARDTIATLVRKTHQSFLHADSLARRADSLVALDSLRPALIAKDSIIGAQTSQIAALSSSVLILSTRWKAADSAAVAWKALALGAQLQVRDLLKQHAPKFGCVGGVSIAGGFGGSEVGLGATCGVRL